jgi:hypothetical protein
VRSEDWIFIIGVPVWRSTGPTRDIGQDVLQFSFEQEVVAAAGTAKFRSYRVTRGGLY